MMGWYPKGRGRATPILNTSNRCYITLIMCNVYYRKTVQYFYMNLFALSQYKSDLFGKCIAEDVLPH